MVFWVTESLSWKRSLHQSPVISPALPSPLLQARGKCYSIEFICSSVGKKWAAEETDDLDQTTHVLLSEQAHWNSDFPTAVGACGELLHGSLVYPRYGATSRGSSGCALPQVSHSVTSWHSSQMSVSCTPILLLPTGKLHLMSSFDAVF